MSKGRLKKNKTPFDLMSKGGNSYEEELAKKK